ncbi:MAG TPA: hypothetical protein VIM55_13035 [Mucilaginibacter sp.]
MNIENPRAFSFIMQDDIYLLDADKQQYTQPAQQAPAATVAEPEPVYMSPAPPPVKETQPLSFNYLGGNKKNFCVMVHYPEHDFMHEKHLAALEATIGRLGFTRDDVAIFNRAKYPDAAFDVISAFFKPQKLLILGSSSRPSGIGSVALNTKKIINNHPTLFTFSFDEMMDSVENKKAFWEQMKLL